MIYNYFEKIVKMHFHRKRWRDCNKHNSTSAETFFNRDNVIVGNYTYGKLFVGNNDDNANLKIGNYVSIAGNVWFLVGLEHRLDTISTFPFKEKTLKRVGYEAFSKGDIIIDDDVWIGQNAIILSGVHIGQGAVISAGAVVTSNVPPYAIVGGVPAKIIKYRFCNELIDELIQIDYSRLTKDMIEKHEKVLYEKLEMSNQLKWLPKKSKW